MYKEDVRLYILFAPVGTKWMDTTGAKRMYAFMYVRRDAQLWQHPESTYPSTAKGRVVDIRNHDDAPREG